MVTGNLSYTIKKQASFLVSKKITQKPGFAHFDEHEKTHSTQSIVYNK